MKMAFSMSPTAGRTLLARSPPPPLFDCIMQVVDSVYINLPLVNLFQ